MTKYYDGTICEGWQNRAWDGDGDFGSSVLVGIVVCEILAAL
jgi:hypothetical protein